MANYLVAILSLSLAALSSAAFEIVDHGDANILLAQGKELLLHCATDEPYDYCRWTLPSGEKCSVSADDVGEVTTCHSAYRVNWNLGETSCGIYLQDVERGEDAGEYKCMLTRFDSPEDLPVTASNVFNVDVALPARPSFGGVFDSTEEKIQVVLGEYVEAACFVNGGYPDAEVRLAVGAQEGAIDEEADRILQTTDDVMRSENDDGSANLELGFDLTPESSDCGHFVKCEARQSGLDGELLFEAAIVSKKIEVLFAPLPLTEPLGPFEYDVGTEMLQVNAVFMANPPPGEEDVRWSMSMGMENETMDTALLQPGQADAGGKYEALALEVTGHMVTASLKIYDLDLLDKDMVYALEAANKHGENRYQFALTTDHVEPAEEVTYRAPYPSEEQDGSEEEPEANGAAVGTIIAIVLVIVIGVGGICFMCWAKSSQRFCFKPYDSVKQADPEHADKDSSGVELWIEGKPVDRSAEQEEMQRNAPEKKMPPLAKKESMDSESDKESDTSKSSSDEDEKRRESDKDKESNSDKPEADMEAKSGNGVAQPKSDNPDPSDQPHSHEAGATSSGPTGGSSSYDVGSTYDSGPTGGSSSYDGGNSYDD